MILEKRPVNLGKRHTKDTHLPIAPEKETVEKRPSILEKRFIVHEKRPVNLEKRPANLEKRPANLEKRDLHQTHLAIRPTKDTPVEKRPLNLEKRPVHLVKRPTKDTSAEGFWKRDC